MPNKTIELSEATQKLRSESPLPFDKLISGISFSGIERRPKGPTSLYMCHVTQGCPNTEVKQHREATRIDFDFVTGEIKMWLLAFDPSKPDVVIENAVLPLPRVIVLE